MKRLILIALLALSACDKVRGPRDVTNPAGAAQPGPQTGAPNQATNPGGGTDFGGGSDMGMRYRYAHWFPFKKKITVCIRRADNFEVGERALHTLVDETFQTWNEYLFDNDPDLHRLALEVTIEPKCTDASDVEFLFGVIDERVANSRRRYHDPFGMASFHAGKGFVWVAPHSAQVSHSPDWKSDGHLNAVLLHEVGHIYGNEHVEGTVMAADLGEFLDEIPKSWMRRIDHSRQLLACITCVRFYSTKVTSRIEGNNIQQVEAIKQITGDAGEYPWQLNFETHPIRKTQNLVLDITWHNGHRRLTANLSDRLDVGEFFSGVRVFLMMGDDGNSTSQYSAGYEFRNIWTSDDGKKYEIIYGVNMATSESASEYTTYPARLQLLQDGQRIPIANYSSDAPDEYISLHGHL